MDGSMDGSIDKELCRFVSDTYFGILVVRLRRVCI